MNTLTSSPPCHALFIFFAAIAVFVSFLGSGACIYLQARKGVFYLWPYVFLATVYTTIFVLYFILYGRHES